MQQTFNDPSVTGGDEFGTSVALDGSRVLIGAPSNDTQGISVGQAYLFAASTSVPEPPTLALLAAGLVGIALWGYPRRARGGGMGG